MAIPTSNPMPRQEREVSAMNAANSRPDIPMAIESEESNCGVVTCLLRFI